MSLTGPDSDAVRAVIREVLAELLPAAASTGPTQPTAAQPAPAPPARHKAWRNITTSCWLHWSKCPSHNCSLMSCVSSPIDARLCAGVLRSNEQLTCRDSSSGSQVKATS